MNITDNLIRIKEGKDNIIKSLKNKGVEISDDTLISEIPTIIDNAEIGEGDTPEQPEIPELVQKYEGASVFRMETLKDECEIGFAPFLKNTNYKDFSYVIDWGDGSAIEEIDTDSHIYHIYNKKGIYDINCYNFNNTHYIYTNKEIQGANGVQYLNAFDNPKNDSYSFGYTNNKEYDYKCTNILVGNNLDIYNISNNPYLETIYIKYIPTSSSLLSVYYRYSNNPKLRILKSDFDLTIDRGNFNNCISLESIITPNGVVLMYEDSLFSGCKRLKNITLKSTTTKYLPNSTFSGCSSLTSITIPETVTSIGTYAFSGCSSLTSITIPESVTSIGQSVFNGCSSLTSITIPESVTSIGTYAFQNCTSLTSITIPESVTSIGQSVFNGCSSLTSITIPESVTSIGSSAFSGCKNLQYTEIPNSINTINSSAFSNCSSLQSITCEAMTAPTIQSNSFPTSDLKYTKRYLYVPKDSQGYDSGNWKTYLIDKGWELRYIEDYVKTPTTLKLKTTNNFFHNLQAIGQAKLINYELIDNEYIYHFDDKITELLQYTFYTTVLKEIDLPESVTSISNYAFRGCSSLTSIILNEGLTSIGTYAFGGCSSLTSITIPESVTSIGQSVFNGCSSLTSITIPESVTSISSNAFGYCYNLSTITCKAMTAPTIQSDSFSSVGSSVPSGTPKILRVPEGASGYDSGYWKSTVLDKGYTLEYFKL